MKLNGLVDRYAGWRIIHWFSMNSDRKVHVNELSRELGLSGAACSKILRELKENGFVDNEKIGTSIRYGMLENQLTTRLKQFMVLLDFQSARLVDTILKNDDTITNIILFGSCATGHFLRESDLDILVISNRKVNADLRTLEDRLGRKINVVQMNIGNWAGMKARNDGFYTEVKKYGVLLFGSDLP